jgi:hypothetical protein
MKKTLLIATVAALTGLSSFGQGYFLLGGAARASWDLFTPANAGVPKLGATANIALFWGSASATPLVESSLASGLGSPTNAVSQYLSNPWTAILGDGAFQRVVDNNTSLAVQPANGSNGSWAYTTTGGFSAAPVTGTSPGTAVHMYVIGWDKAYSTIAAAAAAGAAVGYSGVFTYTPVDSIGTPPSLSASGFVPFGINAVPEPASFALAGLGMAAMLVSRRRK